VRDVLSGVSDVYLFLFTFGISVALVVMGNTLARLIGVAFLAIWVLIAAQWVRRRRAADDWAP
jgi:hypothetical protein